MTEQHEVHYLRDYQPPGYRVDELMLDVVIEDAKVIVTSVAAYRRNPDANSAQDLILDGESELLTLVSVAMNGQVLTDQAYTLTDQSLQLHDSPDRFELTVVTQFNPEDNHKLSGLYVSRGNYCTQCESHGFRRMTYFQDRPDVLTLFTTRITADKKRFPQMLANGNLVKDDTLKEGLRQVTWHDPSLKPCYLFALVVGDFDQLADTFQTQSGREVAIRLYVEQGMHDQAGFALESIKQAMKWDEETFDREYDLDIFMVVAVSDFNYGAMENKGLNIFNSKYILASPETATDQDYIHVQGVIGHEYFHNWSGNRVTCRDWFQISLKEGLTVFRDQSFTMDMFSPGVKRIEDANIIRSVQFTQDSGPMAHPIRPPSYIEISNFYTVTVYNKGAEVIRMIETILGKQAFKQALNLYFERHDGQAVTTDDFVSAMEDSSGVDLSQFRLWYSQAGTPELKVSDAYDEVTQVYRLTIKQHCPDTPGQSDKQPMHIPVRLALLSPDGERLPLYVEGEHSGSSSDVFNIQSTEQTLVFEQVKNRPIPSLLQGFSAPVICHYPYTEDQLKVIICHDQDPFAAWQAGQALAERHIVSLVQDFQAGRELAVNSEFSRSLRLILEREDIEPYLCADLMTLPSMAYLAERMDQVDVDALFEARKVFMQQIANDIFDVCHSRYSMICSDRSAYKPTFAQMGQRRLANRCLAYMAHAEQDEGRILCEQHYHKADNLTERLGALMAINHCDDDRREKMLAQFYREVKDQDLVLDRWFMLQASSSCTSTIQRVKSLSAHEDYHIDNPNRVRALVGAFSRNMHALHEASGQGYAWLVAQVLMIDQRNPQVAARLVEPLIHWRKYKQDRSHLMHESLLMLEKRSVSKDIYELVHKCL